MSSRNLKSNPAYSYDQISATANAIQTGPGIIKGIFVSAASSTPTITVYDGLTSGGTLMVYTFTPVAGDFYEFDAFFGTGLTVVISGTVQATVFSCGGNTL